MIKAFLVGSLMALINSPTLASEKLVKFCQSTLIQPGEEFSVDTRIEIYKRSNLSHFAKVTQTVNGQSSSYEEVVTIKSNAVRAGLTGKLDNAESLNYAESLIVHAMTITENLILGGTFSAGMVLSDVRFAKVYTIGRPEEGVSAIVEAKDAAANPLGSFFGGFLVSPCK